MVQEALDTVDEVLAGAADDIDDSEALYKIRDARQLLELANHRLRARDEAIEEMTADEELLNNLREPGYLE